MNDVGHMGLRFLDHGGETGRMIRDHDWSATSLGPLEGWPQALLTPLGICLSSVLPTAIYWGRDLRLLYNDAWSTIPAERHPACLGQPAREVWFDIWDTVGPQFERVLDSGEGFAAYDQPLVFQRDGVPVETWWNYSFTPIRDGRGNIVGIFNQGNETTRTVLAERNQAAETERLRELFQQAPGAVALLRGPELVYEFANSAYGALVGDRPLVGRRLIDVLPEVEDTFLPILEQVRRTGVAYRADAAEVPMFLRDGGTGEMRRLDFVYQPIRNMRGEVADIFVQANDVTDRVRAEQALRASEERLQLALDASIGIGIWDWDIAADRVTSDARFAQLYGVDPQLAAEGAPIERFFGGIHPDDLPRVRAAIDEAMTGAPFVEEYRLLDHRGRIRWIAAQGRVHFDADGRPIRFPGVSFDITKRRAAEEAARVAADDLRAATEAQAFVFRLAERMRALDSVAQILRLAATALGRRLNADRVGFYRVLSDDLVQHTASWTSERMEPLVGTMPTSTFGERNVAAMRAGDTRVLADYATDPLTRGLPVETLAGAGVVVPLRRQGVWAASLYVHNAVPRRWVADEVALVEAVAEIAWDAADRAAAAAAVLESEAKFRAIANSIDQMVWSALPDGYHDYYNERWYEYTGVPPGSTDGEAWNGVFHPDDQARAWDQWRHCLETGEHYRIEYRLRHRSGRYRWVLGAAQPVHDEAGRITRWFGSCTDIQEIVEAREILARSRADLEAAITERTEQLLAAEEQLRQAQKMEAVGQLTGGIAHDFNNMLAVVIGALDLLERRMAKGDTDVARYVEAARDGATRAAGLTQRLLAFSRQTPLAPVALDLNAMIDGMTDMLKRTIGDSIVITTDLAPGLWVATADPSQLENAIINLAVNARDAMPRGGTLAIASANVAVDDGAAGTRHIAPGDYVELTVTDTGSGMAAEVAAKAFDPFFTTKEVGKGTGLGLSQVFGFVRQSKGHIALDTAPGRGTTVRILLPRDAATSVIAPGARTDDRTPHGHEVILVVEDEDRVRTYSVEALRDLGYTVIHAADGPSALAMIDAGQGVDLLFTDVVMPRMTGRELAEEAIRRLPGLRVLYTSGYTRETLEFEGSGAVLTKPFDVATLARRIRHVLDD